MTDVRAPEMRNYLHARELKHNLFWYCMVSVLFAIDAKSLHISFLFSFNSNMKLQVGSGYVPCIRSFQIASLFFLQKTVVHSCRWLWFALLLTQGCLVQPKSWRLAATVGCLSDKPLLFYAKSFGWPSSSRHHLSHSLNQFVIVTEE